MKINKYKKILAETLIFTLIFAISIVSSACKENTLASQDPSEANKDKTMDVYISIDYPEQSKKPDMVNQKFTLEKESSILSVLELYGTVSEIPILIETTSSRVYGIDGVLEGPLSKWLPVETNESDTDDSTTPSDSSNSADIDSQGQWTVEVNDKKINSSLATTNLASGDSVKWIYEIK